MNSGLTRSTPTHVHGRQLHLLAARPRRASRQAEVLGLGQRVSRELRAVGQRRRAPERDRVRHPVERSRADVAHVDDDLHVVGAERLELLPLVRADQHVERARHQRQRRAQFVGGGRRVRHGDRDDDVGTGLPGDVHRHVAGQAAVAEDAAVDGRPARTRRARPCWRASRAPGRHRSSTTISPVCMSVATARNGIGNWSKSGCRDCGPRGTGSSGPRSGC